MNHTLPLCVFLLVVTAALGEDSSPPTPTKPQLPALEDIDGTLHKVPSRSGDGEPVVVLAWTGAECPMARLYLPRLKRLAKEFAPRGVRLFLVNSNTYDSLTEIRDAVGKLPENLAVIRDADGALAKLAGARSTTEVLVLDRARRVVYRGAVDDQYGFRREEGRGTRTYRKDAPTRHYLKASIEAAIAGKPASPTETDPLGCALEWQLDRAAPDAKKVTSPESPVTFHAEIEPILQKHCQRCHRDGGNAPFSLEEYRAARGWRRMIREVVSERRMPPWGADPAHGVFSNDNSLSEAEIAAIVRWVDAGAPRGDPAKAPPRHRLPTGTDIGKVDTKFTTPAFEVPAEGTLPYRYVRVPTSFEEDRWIEAMQITSTTPELVHHVLIFLEGVRPPKPGTKRPWKPPFNPFSLLEGSDPKDYGKWIHRFRKLIKRDLLVGQGGGLDGYLASTSSGSLPYIYPEGRAKLLPAGAKLVFQIHYTPSGKAQTSETTLAVRFAEKPPSEAVDTRAIATVAFKIPPGAADHGVQATNKFLRDGRVISLRPHMHLRGKSFRYVAELPDGRKEILLDVPRYDFDWQLDYIFADPPLLPRGTTLRAVAAFDNSPDNPYNPDPGKEVYFGLQTEDEMMIGYYDVIWSKE